jgi:hypothetical protein
MADAQTANERSNIRQRAEIREREPAEIRRDVAEYVREYARENPGTVALWCFGVGFILGWKLKPW